MELAAPSSQSLDMADRRGARTKLGVDDGECLLVLALLDYLLGEELLQPLAQLALLKGRDVLHRGRGGRETMQALELKPNTSTAFC
jgi:hypothetical protein